MTAVAASTFSTLVSLLLSFILPFSMLADTLTPGDIATITSTMTVQEESAGVEMVFYRTEQNQLNASFVANENGEKRGISFKDDKLHMIRGEGSSTVEEYIFRMERAVENGLATQEDLSFYKELVALQPVFSYLADGHFMEDVNTVMPWLRGKIPTLEQLLGIRTTQLEGYRTQYNFTLHLRDLPVLVFNLALRSLASSSFRTMINNLHVWDMIEEAPGNPADYLLMGLGQTEMDLDELPALTLPVEMVIDADGKIESFSAETVYYERYDYTEIELNYANGHLQAAVRPYRSMNGSYVVPQGALELNACADVNGGSVDISFGAEDETLHFFANYQLMHGKLWSVDAQYTLATYYDICTATLTYRPSSLIVALYANDSVLTGDLRWVKTNQSLSYWLDATATDSYYADAYLVSANGSADWKDGLNHNLQLTLRDLEMEDTISVSLNQRFVDEVNKYTHDVTGTVTQTSARYETTETTPFNWNTVITLK